MALTRANAEFLLEARVGSLMTAAGLDGTTVDGTNVDLNDPIGRAVRACDHAVTDLTSVADADVAQVVIADYDKFLDFGQYFALDAILGNLDMVDIATGPRSEKLSQLASQVERMMKRLRARLDEMYGFGLAIVKAGYITKDFAEHD